jgi:hypothetical protein
MKLKNPEEAVQTKSGQKLVFSCETEKELEYLLFMKTRLSVWHVKMQEDLPSR